MSIASKEARETSYWLDLLDQSKLVDLELETERAEILEIVKMLTAIVKTASQNSN